MIKYRKVRRYGKCEGVQAVLGNLRSGTHKTKTAAREEIEEEASRVLSGDYTPVLVKIETLSSIVYRDLYGWQHGLCLAFGRTKEDAISNASHDLLQQVWSPDWDDMVLLKQASGLSDRDRDRFLTWTAWQRRYEAGVRANLTSDEARDYANGMRAAVV